MIRRLLIVVLIVVVLAMIGLFLPAREVTIETKSILSIGFEAAYASPGWETGYSYRKMITIDCTKVSGGANLTNFPVLINITSDNDLRTTGNGGHMQNSNGYDTWFTSSDGTTDLYFEIEKYTASTGEYVAWVNIPTLSYTANTVIYLYYGKSGVSANPSSTSTWDSNYKGVWHLKEDASGTGTARLYQDSTSNDNDGDDYVSATGKTGKINNGQEFDGIDDYVRVPDADSLDITSAITLEAWVKLDSNYDTGCVISKDNAVSGRWHSYKLDFWDGTTRPGFRLSSSTTYYQLTASTLSIGWNTWGHVAATWNGSIMRIYVNGIADPATTAFSGSLVTTTYPVSMGTNIYWTNIDQLDGTIDEVRISNIARSAGWIATGYNNQSSPGTFYTVGAEEPNISISNTPSSKAFGVVQQNSSYWSKGSAPTFPLDDGECFFTVTNNGGAAVNISIRATNFSGGVGWTLTSGSPGVNTVRMKAGKSGDAAEGNMVILTTSNQIFISGLGASASKKWEIKLETGTFTDGAGKTSTITLTATVS